MAELVFVDDVVDGPMTEEQRETLKTWWNESKCHAHVRSTPYLPTDWLGRYYFGSADGQLERAH